MVSAIAGERRAIVDEAADEFGGDVLGVGGAAAVAGEQHLAAVAQRARDAVGDGDDRGDEVRGPPRRARPPRASGGNRRGRHPHADRPWRAPGSVEPCLW